MKNVILIFVTDSRFDFIKITVTIYGIVKNCVTNDGKRAFSSVRRVTNRRRLATLNKYPGSITSPPQKKIQELIKMDVLRIRGKESVIFQLSGETSPLC